MINKLPLSLINKIAAGEVVERPASVIKELLENSIDAGASRISVEIRDGGISFIRIIDDGCGIQSDEIKTAFLRHATSKISSFEDLEAVLTLGFRGEALSSIAGVSQVEIRSKTRDSDMGIKLEIHGGEIINEVEIGCGDGTDFTVRNLFYNVPARRKFLKKAATESGYCLDVVTRAALSHPEISFKYINNNSEMLSTNGSGDLKSAILAVLGKDSVKNMQEVEYEKSGLKFSGFLGTPALSRGNRSYENFFINGRYIKSTILSQALEEAFKNRLTSGKYPVCVINMKSDPRFLDVNVHPAKLEVRFSDENLVYNALFEACKLCLDKKPLVTPSIKPQINQKTSAGAETGSFYKVSVISGEEKAEKGNITEKTETQADSPIFKDEKASYAAVLDDNLPQNAVFNFSLEKKEDGKPDFKIIEIEEEPFFKNYKIVGQVFGTYWFIESGGTLYIIDQHAAHERILFEDFYKKFKSGGIVSQPLALPLVVNLNEGEKAVLNENIEMINSFGFDIDVFGENSYAIREVPYIFQNPANPSFFIDIIDKLYAIKPEQHNVYDLKAEEIATIACKAAVKGNNRLSFIEAREMIDKLLKLENPFTCPHGRPTIIEMTKSELEKKFLRMM